MGKKIMVVDDSDTIRQAVSYTLKQAGYETCEATNGISALKESEKGKVDLVITDLNMNFMDGLQLIRKLREGGPNKYTPILMLTTESNPEKKEEGKAAGATGWIVKPFVPEKLLEVVQKVLR